MQRIGCFTSGWLLLCTAFAALGAFSVFTSDRVREKLMLHPIPFGSFDLDAAYLVAIAVLCVLILCGETWALHIWLVLGIAAYISLTVFQPGAPTDVYNIFHIIRPAIIYVFLYFGGASRGSR